MDKTKVVIVDDEPVVREMLKELFESSGYEVTTFENGATALDGVQKTVFDISLIDIGLPDISGLDLLKKIKEISPEMICAIITGEATIDSSIDAIHTGADCYFLKPFYLKDVLHRLNEILEKKRMQQEINKLNEFPKTILNSINESIAIINVDDFKIVSVNKHFLDKTGLSEAEVVGKTCHEITHKSPLPCDSVNCLCPLSETVRIGHHFSTVHVHHDKNGKTTYVELSSSPITDSNGKVQQVVYTSRDITERKEFEISLENEGQILKVEHEQINQAYSELKKTQSQIIQQEKMATIGQLAAGVAHEINNPVGFISSNLSTLKNYVDKLVRYTNTQNEYLQTLADEPLLEEFRQMRERLKVDYVLQDLPELIRESLEGTQRVRDIVNNLKSFSRISDKDEVASDINECLDTTLKIVWNELKYKTEVKKEYGDIPLVTCFPQQLNQVFMNILMNASHAIKEKGIITIKTERKNETLHISISDTGCGMPEKDRAKIFEPFFTTKVAGKGTGLGMSISLDIIKKHNGEILVESQEGQGTTFTVILPIKS